MHSLKQNSPICLFLLAYHHFLTENIQEMLHIKNLLHNFIFVQSLSDWLLFNTKWDIFSYLMMRNDDNACVVLEQHSDQDFYSDSSQSTSIIDMFYTQKEK